MFPPGICLTPATLAAAVALVEMGIALEMYNALKDKLYDCAERAMGLAETIFEKRKALLNQLGDLYDKLCGVPERKRCDTAAACAMEYSVMAQGAELLEQSLNSLDCYQVGAGREIIRSAMGIMAESAVAAKVDACLIEDSLDDARQILSASAIVSAPTQGNEYYGVANAYAQVGAQLAGQLAAQAQAFNASATVFGFGVGEIFNQRREARSTGTRATAPISPILNPGRVPTSGQPGFFDYP